MAHERLVKYLRETKKRGYSYDKIKLALLKKGWPERHVEEAWKVVIKESEFFGRRFFSLTIISLLAFNLAVVLFYSLFTLNMITSLYFNYVAVSIAAILGGWLTYETTKKMIEDVDLRTMVFVSVSFLPMVLIGILLVVMMNANAGAEGYFQFRSALEVRWATVFFSVLLYFLFFHSLLIREFYREKYHANFFVVFSSFIFLLVLLISYIAQRILF